MTETRMPCPRCGQDWLYDVRLIHLEQDAVLCPECDALWLRIEEIGVDTFRDYGTYMMDHGRGEPEAPGELLVRGLLLRPPKATT
jgi:hypothetical protein